MKTTLIGCVAILLCSAFIPSDIDSEEEAIFKAVFTHQDVSRALIHIPRWERSPTQLVLLQNEFTADVERVRLRSAHLVVMDEAELVQNRVNLFYVIDKLEQSGNTASLSFEEFRVNREEHDAGDYSAKVSLARLKGEWVATQVRTQ